MGSSRPPPDGAIDGEFHKQGDVADGKLRIVGGADIAGCDTGKLHWKVAKKWEPRALSPGRLVDLLR